MTNGPQSKAPAIPDWQKNTSGDPSDCASKTPRDAATGNPAPDRSALLEQAKIFLQDPAVRDAPHKRKAAFLEEKGLHDHEIAEVLDEASSPQASSAQQESSLKTIHDSSASSSSPSSPSESDAPSPDAPPAISLSPKAKPAISSERDAPPIITYPEFLLRPTKPPPLVTFQRLSYALYTLGGISALTYGASKYLVQPMLESLTSARHELSRTALHNLERLNHELEENVSHVPAMSNSNLSKGQVRERARARARHNLPDNEDDHGSGSDAETIDSDPTELFHRDTATQTSPGLLARSSSAASRRSRSSSSSSLSSTFPSKDATGITTTTNNQSRRLSTLATSLSSLVPTTVTENTTITTTTTPFNSTSSTSSGNETLLQTISDCQAYLDKLQFSTNSYSDYNLLYGSAPPIRDFTSSTGGRSGGGGGKDGIAREDGQDEAMTFRQEIRAIKGALLSVRNFPVGRPATATDGVGDVVVGVGAR